jgi:hypothetical protein
MLTYSLVSMVTILQEKIMGWTIWGWIAIRDKRVSYSPKCPDLPPTQPLTQ